jgi:hypothetical protein
MSFLVKKPLWYIPLVRKKREDPRSKVLSTSKKATRFGVSAISLA